jgi:hypothetical protein
MDVKRDSEQMFDNPVEAEPPRYESAFLALLEDRKPAAPIEIPPPSPENEARIRQMGDRLGREVEKARERAYGEGEPVVSEGATRFMAAGRPIADAELSPGDLARLNALRAEWKAWHEDPANADWRPDGGQLVVG